MKKTKNKKKPGRKPMGLEKPFTIRLTPAQARVVRRIIKLGHAKGRNAAIRWLVEQAR